MTVATNYNLIADKIISDVKNGLIKPGEQLLPQREFAYLHDIAPSTASRVYAELVKRGVAVGEVGRGTFIRAFDQIPAALGEPAKEPINMQLNFSVLPEQAEIMADYIKPLSRADVLEQSLYPVGVEETEKNRKITADFLSNQNWKVDQSSILYTNGGRQGLTAAMAATASIGERIGVEQLTYTIVKGIAERLGIHLVPLEMDEDGICINALRKTHEKTPLKSIYFQTYLQNPLGINMPKARQNEFADFLKEKNIIGIEDAVYAFLADQPSFASIAPENTIYVDSLSKRLSPGLGYGFVVTPQKLKNKMIAALRMGGWTTSSISFAICQQLLDDGAVARIAKLRQKDAKMRQSIAHEILSDLEFQTDPRSYNIWLYLPDNWRADEFAAHLSKLGVAVTPASSFSVDPGNAPNAIRLALAPPSVDDLKMGLNIVHDLATSKTS